MIYVVPDANEPLRRAESFFEHASRRVLYGPEEGAAIFDCQERCLIAVRDARYDHIRSLAERPTLPRELGSPR